MNRELSKGLSKKVKKRFPNLNLTIEDTCQITIMTLSTIAGFLRKKTTFNGARLLEYAGRAVRDFLAEKD